MRYLISSLALLISVISSGQELSGSVLLDSAIAYHDPTGSWPTFNGNLGVTMSTPDGKERVSDITINFPEEVFELRTTQEGNTMTQTLIKGQCELLLNGSSSISKEDQEKHRLSCERAAMYKNYYTYLYGLPMKLKDPGTIVHEKTAKKTFKGKEYLVLKVTYEKDVGGDIWYFYFNPKTYAMEVYQFFRDESIPDGEYILLSGEMEASRIKIPKTRAWYYNKDDKYLGTDLLTKARSL